MQNQNETKITFCCSRAIKQKIEWYADSSGMSMSDLIRGLLLDYIAMRDAEASKPIIPAYKR